MGGVTIAGRVKIGDYVTIGTNATILPDLEISEGAYIGAGAYIVGGKNYYKNEYLGTTTWDECADYLNNNLKFNSKVFCLRENQIYDIKNQKQLEKYKKLDTNEMKNYIQSLKNKKYEYENDDITEISKLKNDVYLASTKFIERVNKFNIELKSNVYLKIENENVQIVKGKETNRHLYCDLDSDY